MKLLAEVQWDLKDVIEDVNEAWLDRDTERNSFNLFYLNLSLKMLSIFAIDTENLLFFDNELTKNLLAIVLVVLSPSVDETEISLRVLDSQPNENSEKEFCYSIKDIQGTQMFNFKDIQNQKDKLKPLLINCQTYVKQFKSDDFLSISFSPQNGKKFDRGFFN